MKCYSYFNLSIIEVVGPVLKKAELENMFAISKSCIGMKCSFQKVVVAREFILFYGFSPFN